MANTRKSSRKASRKDRKNRKDRKASRKASRKAQRKSSRKNTRRMKGGRGIFGTVYSPVSHVLRAAEESVSAVTDTTRNIVRKGLSGVDKIGKSLTGHADMAVRNVVSRKNRKDRR